MSARFVVPGEDLAWPVPLVLLLVATVTGGAAAGEWRGPARPPTPSPPAASPPRAAPSAAASVLPATPSAQPASSTPPATSSCPRLIIHFAHAAATAPASAGAPLEKLASWLVAHPAANAVLDGHADAVGTEHGNLVLSRSRAEHVAGALAAHGVARKRLTARGFGAFNPIEAEPDTAFNRRVVVHVRPTDPVAACPFRDEEVIEP